MSNRQRVYRVAAVLFRPCKYSRCDWWKSDDEKKKTFSGSLNWGRASFVIFNTRSQRSRKDRLREGQISQLVLVTAPSKEDVNRTVETPAHHEQWYHTRRKYTNMYTRRCLFDRRLIVPLKYVISISFKSLELVWLKQIKRLFPCTTNQLNYCDTWNQSCFDIDTGGNYLKCEHTSLSTEVSESVSGRKKKWCWYNLNLLDYFPQTYILYRN